MHDKHDTRKKSEKFLPLQKNPEEGKKSVMSDDSHPCMNLIASGSRRSFDVKEG